MVSGSGVQYDPDRTSETQTVTLSLGIRGVAIAGAQPVGVNANGQLGIRAPRLATKKQSNRG